MEKVASLDIIINLVCALKKGGEAPCLDSFYNGKSISFYGVKYILGQYLRHYKLPEDHYLVSVGAYNKWMEIVGDSDDIRKYFYKEQITCNNNNVKVNLFKGSETKPYMSKNLNRGEKFVYNSVFINEHMITIKDIINELLALEKPDYDSVLSIIDKIYICRILKEEDHNLKPKSHRSLDVDDVIKNVYNKNGVFIYKG